VCLVCLLVMVVGKVQGGVALCVCVSGWLRWLGCEGLGIGRSRVAFQGFQQLCICV